MIVSTHNMKYAVTDKGKSMTISSLSQIKGLIEKLSFDELIELLEHLSLKIRHSAERQRRLEEDVIAMAFDPEFQRELELIEKEFLVTLVDGLEA